jgi:F-type H+-transporting ATPase subunit gamma
MDRSQLLAALIRQYLFVQLYRACAESLASENTSRLLTMQTAEKNIDERIDELNISYHSRRQEAITGELLDVISGFEVLSK